MRFLAIDLGTSFIKTGIYDTDGNCCGIEKEAVEDERPRPGVVVQRAEKLFGSVIRCIQKTVKSEPAAAAEVEALTFTGQMAGFMGVDKDWNDVTTWSCFIDGRFVPYANRQMDLYADRFLNVSGTNSPVMAPKIEWFLSEYPEKACTIRKYMMISGYVIGKLGNLPIDDAVMDHSFLSWTGLGNIRTQEWSEELCLLAGTKPEFLPRIVKSNDICGYLCEEMAAVTGLKSGLPLVSGAGDKVAGNVGAGVLSEGESIFEAGSYGAVSVYVSDYRTNPEANYYDAIPAAVDGLYIHKYIPGSGMTLDWFVDTFLKGRTKKEAFAEMEEKVPKIDPGCEGLMAIGLLGGNAMPFDGEIKGLWMGHTWSHREEHFYRALLESFAYDLALTTDSVRQVYPEYTDDTIKVIGGGARSRAWLQILADVTGRTFVQLDREDVALWGASILAGNAVGVFTDIKKTAAEHCHELARVVPDLSRKAVYQEKKELYRDYVKRLHDFYLPLQQKA